MATGTSAEKAGDYLSAQGVRTALATSVLGGWRAPLDSSLRKSRQFSSHRRRRLGLSRFRISKLRTRTAHSAGLIPCAYISGRENVRIGRLLRSCGAADPDRARSNATSEASCERQIMAQALVHHVRQNGPDDHSAACSHGTSPSREQRGIPLGGLATPGSIAITAHVSAPQRSTSLTYLGGTSGSPLTGCGAS